MNNDSNELTQNEVNNIVDMLLEHYEEGRFAPEEDKNGDTKPLTQVQRNARYKLKKQVEEFRSGNKQKSLFLLSLFGVMKEITTPQRLMNENKKLRHQVKHLTTTMEQEVSFAMIQEREKLKIEMDEKFEEDNKDVRIQLEKCRQRLRKYTEQISKHEEEKTFMRSQKTLSPEEYSEYNTRKAELTILGLWDDDIPIKAKIKQLTESTDKSSTGKSLKKAKKQIKQLKRRIKELEELINSSSSEEESSYSDDD